MQMFRCKIHLDGWEALHAIFAAELFVRIFIAIDCSYCYHALHKRPPNIS